MTSPLFSVTDDEEIPDIPAKLPVGYRFNPTDEELFGYYLPRFLRCYYSSVKRFDVIDRMPIGTIDLCEVEPFDLPGLAKIKSGDHACYFFTPRIVHSDKNGKTMYKRKTKSGHWKRTCNPTTFGCLGQRFTLSFQHDSPDQSDTPPPILIHEYELQPTSDLPNHDHFVLIKVTIQNRINDKKTQASKRKRRSTSDSDSAKQNQEKKTRRRSRKRSSVSTSEMINTPDSNTSILASLQNQKLPCSETILSSNTMQNLKIPGSTPSSLEIQDLGFGDRVIPSSLEIQDIGFGDRVIPSSLGIQNNAMFYCDMAPTQNSSPHNLLASSHYHNSSNSNENPPPQYQNPSMQNQNSSAYALSNQLSKEIINDVVITDFPHEIVSRHASVNQAIPPINLKTSLESQNSSAHDFSNQTFNEITNDAVTSDLNAHEFDFNSIVNHVIALINLDSSLQNQHSPAYDFQNQIYHANQISKATDLNTCQIITHGNIDGVIPPMDMTAMSTYIGEIDNLHQPLQRNLGEPKSSQQNFSCQNQPSLFGFQEGECSSNFASPSDLKNQDDIYQLICLIDSFYQNVNPTITMEQGELSAPMETPYPLNLSTQEKDNANSSKVYNSESHEPNEVRYTPGPGENYGDCLTYFNPVNFNKDDEASLHLQTWNQTNGMYSLS